tara:strand:+ start:242 stop:364 length:123 start_codon:yes stop_codon:yes gene_type:complete
MNGRRFQKRGERGERKVHVSGKAMVTAFFTIFNDKYNNLS